MIVSNQIEYRVIKQTALDGSRVGKFWQSVVGNKIFFPSFKAGNCVLKNERRKNKWGEF